MGEYSTSCIDVPTDEKRISQLWALNLASGLTVLHIDKDFEVIAAVTGQPVERLSA